MRHTSSKVLKKRRTIVIALVAILIITVNFISITGQEPLFETTEVLSESNSKNELASTVLESLEVKGRAPKTGYNREEFGNGWAVVLGCDMRNRILQEGLSNIVLSEDGCIVLEGKLNDPYTGKVVDFVRGENTSDKVQIDHVVALSDSWQKGAQNLSYEIRLQFANDPLNLLAVDGKSNQDKGDSDAASWLPPNKAFRCRYIARQIAVKKKYRLWVTDAEKLAMKRVLNGCAGQVLPSTS